MSVLLLPWQKTKKVATYNDLKFTCGCFFFRLPATAQKIASICTIDRFEVIIRKKVVIDVVGFFFFIDKPKVIGTIMLTSRPTQQQGEAANFRQKYVMISIYDITRSRQSTFGNIRLISGQRYMYQPLQLFTISLHTFDRQTETHVSTTAAVYNITQDRLIGGQRQTYQPLQLFTISLRIV